MSTRTSAGGAGAARGIGGEPRIFAWLAAHTLAHQRLPERLVPNAVVRAVGLQTAHAMDDVGVRTKPADGAGTRGADGRLFIQAKGGLQLSKKSTSDLAEAVDQAVAQWHARIDGRRLQEERDRLVIVTDTAASVRIQKDLRCVINRLATASDEPAARNSGEREALSVLRGHIKCAWRKRTGSTPSAGDLTVFHRLLRLLVLDLDEGKPDRVAAEELLRRVLDPTEEAANAWDSLTVVGQSLNEQQQWFRRCDLVLALRHRGYSLSATALDHADKGIDSLLQAQVRAAELFANPFTDRPTPAVDVYVRQSILSSTPKGSDAFTPQSFREVLARSGSRHFLIFGEAGIGKSTLTRQEAAQLASRALDGPSDEDPRPLLPIWVSALDLAEGQGSMTTRVVAAITKAMGPLLEHELPGNLLATSVDEPWLLLIDGLDEISDPVRHLQMVKTLAMYAREEDGIRMVITTRPLPEDQMTMLRAAGFGPYALQYLGRGQLTEFTRKWFGDDPAAKQFLAQANRPELRELIRVPLMATLAAILHEEDPERALPAHRYTLYEQFLQRLPREVPCRTTSSGRTAPQQLGEQLGDLIHHLAQVQVSGIAGDLLPYAIEWTDSAIGRRWTRQLPNWSEVVAKTLTDTGLFIRTGSGLRIVHMGFAEHLAAEVNAERLPVGFDPGHPDWQGVLTRAIGAQSRQDVLTQSLGLDAQLNEDDVVRDTLVHYSHLRPQTATGLVKHLQTRGRNGQLLAGYLMGEGDMSTAGPGLESLIGAFLDHLRDAVHREEERLETWLHTAGPIHAPLIQDYLNTLAKDRGRETYIRTEAARALAYSRPDQAVDALRSLADDDVTDPNSVGSIVRTLLDIDPAQAEWAAGTLRGLLHHPSASPASICEAAENLAPLSDSYADEAAGALLMSAANHNAAPSDRLDAARLLGELGLPAYRERCVHALWNIVDAPDTDFFERTEAMRELSFLDTRGADEVAEMMLDYLMNEGAKKGRVRDAAEVIIASSPHRIDEVVASLRTLVEEPGVLDATRKDAEAALYTLLPRQADLQESHPRRGPDPSPPVERMCRMLADPQEDAHGLLSAAEALSELGLTEAEQGAAALRGRIAKASTSADVLDCVAAMRELGSGYAPDVAATLRGLITASTTPWEDRMHATRILIELGPAYAPYAFEYLRGVIASPGTDEDTQDDAILSMRHFRPEYAPRVAEYLRSLLTSLARAASARRRVLSESLRALGPLWAAEAAHELRAVMNDAESPGSERVCCASSLARFGGRYEVEGTAWLRGFMKDTRHPNEDRDFASDWLSEITEKFSHEQNEVMKETMPELYAALTERGNYR